MNLSNLSTQERLIYNELIHINHDSIWGRAITNTMHNDLTYDRFKLLLAELKDQAIDNKETMVDIVGERLTDRILALSTFRPVVFNRKNVDKKKKSDTRIFVEIGRLFVDNQGTIEYEPGAIPFLKTLTKTIPISFCQNPDTQQWFVASDTHNGFSFEPNDRRTYKETVYTVADALIEHHFKGLRLVNKSYVFSIIDNPTHENGLTWYPLIFKKEI